MIAGVEVVVSEGGAVSQPGVNFGRARQQPRLIERRGEYALFHRLGGAVWAGIGNYKYEPTRYDLVKLSDLREGKDYAFEANITEVVVSETPGNEWLATRRTLIEQLRQLGQ